MITITLPIIPRPIRWPYLQIMLSTLFRNDLSGFKFFINVEPPWDYNSSNTFAKMMNLLESSSLAMDVKVNDKRLGLDQNTHGVISRAFDAGSDFNLHIEDDLVFSPDALDLARWYHETFVDSPESYFCYGLYSSNNDFDHPISIVKLPGFFLGWGWCVFRKNWENTFVPLFFDRAGASERFGNSEHFDVNGGKVDYSWDVCVNAGVMKRGLTMLSPKLSRSKHGGMYGEHTSIQRYTRDFSPVQINLRSLKELGRSYLLEVEKE